MPLFRGMIKTGVSAVHVSKPIAGYAAR